MKKFSLLLFWAIYTSLSCSAQNTTIGTEFWLAYMENVTLIFNGSPEFGITVHAEETTQGMIEVPATGLAIPFTAMAGESTEILLPEAVWYSQNTEVIEDKGIRITTDLPVRIDAMHYRIYFSDGAKLLPIELLSDEYMILAAEDLNSNSPSTLVIAATEDSTEIEIIPSVLTQGLRPPGLPFNIFLDAGQIYQIHASTDLTGTTIRALDEKKIAVFSGAQQADVACEIDDSHLWEQMHPKELWGDTYLLLPYEGMSGDEFKILAGEDSTFISFNCGEEVVQLNAGESYSFEANEEVRLDSDHPIALGQFNTGLSCNAELGGPSFSLLHPLNLRGSLHNWRAPDNENTITNSAYFNNHICHIIVPTESASLVQLDGESVSFDESETYSGLSFAKLSVSAGNHQIVSDVPVWVQVAGFNDAEAYSFCTGWDGSYDLGLVEAFAVPGPTGSELCVGEEVFFSYESEQSLSNEFWDFGNGNTANDPSPTNIYDEPGIYTVSFSADNELSCSANTSFELEIIDCTNSIVNEKKDEIKLTLIGNQLQVNSILPPNGFLQLMDISGRLIAQSPQGRNILDLSSFPEGVYILRLMGDGPPVSKRFFYSPH